MAFGSSKSLPEGGTQPDAPKETVFAVGDSVSELSVVSENAVTYKGFSFKLSPDSHSTQAGYLRWTAWAKNLKLRDRQIVEGTLVLFVDPKTKKILLFEGKPSHPGYELMTNFGDPEARYYALRARYQALGILDAAPYKDGELPPELAAAYDAAFPPWGGGSSW